MLAYGESGTTPEPIARICQLVRAPCEAATGLRLHVQQPAHGRVPLGALQARLRRTRVLRRDEVQRRERAVRWPAERLALRRLSVSAFVRLAHNERQKNSNQKSEFSLGARNGDGAE
jgi:hypothetical protein